QLGNMSASESSRQSPIEMMRRISAGHKVPDRRTSQPTSVIISRGSPTESMIELEQQMLNRRKRSRHERSISESSTNSAHSMYLPMHDPTGGHPGIAISPKSFH